MKMAEALSATNPFPGLRPFFEADTDWFFGRGREINDLLKRLRRIRFLAVVGPSGCGKSSLVQAGLLPAVRDGYLDAEWRIATFRPGERPLRNLAEAVALAVGGDAVKILAQLNSGPMGLVEAICGSQLAANTNTLLLADQFEELFQFVQRHGPEAQEEAKAFLKLLLAAAASGPDQSTSGQIFVMLTMRVEWLNESASYAGLAEAINEGIYLVPQMSRRQFQQTILGPIEAAQSSVTSALLDRLLNDLDGRADQLPVLQHCLMRMWQMRTPGEPLSVAAYENDKIGTLSGSLSKHAGEIFNDFTPDQKQAAEALFRSITQVVKSRKVRRPRPLGDIAAESGVPLETLKPVVEALRKEGRSFVVTTPGDLNAASIVDISHEALMRQWDQLSKWVDAEAEVQAKISRLQDISAEWANGKRKNSDLLYRGGVLTEAEKLRARLEAGGPAVAFLTASRRADRRSMLIGLVLISCFVLAASGWAWSTYRSTQQEKGRLAQKAADDQKNAQLIADALSKLDKATKTDTHGNAYAEIQYAVRKIQAKRVYLQYSGSDQADMAKALQAALIKQGYAVQGSEDVGVHVPSKSQVRYFNPTDKEAATALADTLRSLVDGRVDAVSTASRLNDPGSSVPVGQLEIWLAAGTSLQRAKDTEYGK